MVTLTSQEFDALSPEERAAHLEAEKTTVFGVGHAVVKGQPQEQGVGSPGHESENHFAAIRKWEGPEAEKKARAEAAKRRAAL
jgi:hypothetical protein